MMGPEIMIPRKKTGVPFRLFVSILLVVLLFPCVSLKADEGGWQPVTELNGIEVFKRIKGGSTLFEFKAVGDLSGPISQYMSVLLETKRMPHWTPLCIEARDIERINDRETIIYVACKGVWPVADREYTAKRALISGPTIGSMRIDVELVDHQYSQNNATRVKIPHLKCRWILKEIDSAHTHVELYADVDPGGWLPDWLVNFGYRKVPHRFLKKLESYVVNDFSHIPVVATASLPQ
ncbi:MAG: hypothetical protein D8M57_12305 [Candidatus Scalindua sp. AMX11]|nr:MAG: hypothetical protein DWQ00_08955 [Candidatus Scalindua sp.]NOG84406.1 hypothetical protein [Planctomycetota bacterium]RZV72477.1 MAG: hypothetical protein EX341_14255 [Candidatus Scalindua sp. SCAELEC01]TDE64632.1 MAG: hypothetical protein D8M57_12305 [Candidatus Scalindua sp. AMX11]GJQ59730.1 MAG: cyclase [Candidatus Scalindua sp.]